MEEVVRTSAPRPRVPRRALVAWAALAAAFVPGPQSAAGQTKSITISVNDYRPMRAALLQIRTLSDIPVNYEDVRYDYPGDQLDKTEGSFSPAQIQMSIESGYGPPKLIVPRGGSLSFSDSVDESTGRLPDLASTRSALESALAAYNSSSLPGKFQLEAYEGEFIVAPVQQRDASGATVPSGSVLSTPVTLPPFEESAMERADRILRVVTQATGYKAEIGAVPINGMAMTHVDLSGSTEPASHLLIHLLNRVMGYPSALPPGAPALAYHLLYGPRSSAYSLNAIGFGHRNAELPPPPAAPPTGSGRPFASPTPPH